MQFRAFVLMRVALAASAVGAAEKFPLLKVGTNTYANVTVTSVSATEIYFVHSRGMGNAKLKSLEPELQKHFGYDANKAGVVEKKQAEADLAFRQGLNSRSPLTVPAAAAGPSPATGEKIAAGDVFAPEIFAKSFRGGPAPELVVEKWLTAKPETKGKFVLIDFWATWCAPCRRSIPELNRIYEKFKDRLVIIGLSDESEEDVRAMKSPAIDYYVGIDPAAKTKSEVGVRGIPHAILMDPQGVVRFEGHPGYLNERGLNGLLAKYSK